MPPDASFCPSCGRAVPDAPGVADSMPFAGYGRRVGAWLVDLAVLCVLAAILVLVLVAVPQPDTPSEVDAAALAVTGIVLLIVCLLPCYSALLHRFWSGQTVGKRTVGIAVRRLDGIEIGLGQSLGRSYLRAAFWVFWPAWVADSLWPLNRADGRSLHDLAAGTVVLRAAHPEA